MYLTKRAIPLNANRLTDAENRQFLGVGKSHSDQCGSEVNSCPNAVKFSRYGRISPSPAIDHFIGAF